MNRLRSALARWIAFALLALLVPSLGLRAQAPPVLDKERLKTLDWREIGPYRGGRSAAVTGVEGHPRTYYFGATGGGVWKSEDAGVSWKNVSDGFFGGSVGSVAVSPSDPNVLYVGGGEKTVRGNVSHGYGVWKSTDAGRTWSAAGLEDSHHIPRIRVDPRDPNRLYAAVLGHLYEDHPTRGIYRSLDAGASWQRILHVSDAVGAAELVMDPTNPRTLYATFWRVRRTPWSLESGGEGSGIWKSTDSGDHWQEITRNEGLPQGVVGISGITVSPTNPQNLYAIIEADDGGVFRSRDGGETWKRTSEDRSLRQRAWYYSRIYADPRDEESVYIPNVRFHHSKDGGKTFRQIDTPHGDHHDLWISQKDPLRMIHGSDGGASVSLDGGTTWSRQDNQPTAQIYRLSTDDRFPFRIYGGQQDNSALRIVHRSDGAGIGSRDWQPTAGGESGHIVADPKDPEIVYGGSYGGYLVRLDHRTGLSRVINVWPDNPMGWAAKDLRYRFQWNFPVLFSLHDPEALYAAGNLLFQSTDEGQSWAAISPDLTRNDPSKMESSGGPITKDNTSVEYYGTIFSVAESRHEAGVLWTGSDDGLIHITRDFGENWVKVTPPALPPWATVNSLEAHPHNRKGLYVAATAYKTGDFSPYLFKTLDYGRTWIRIDRGIDRQHFTRVLRADPQRKGLLFAGTETGIYVSFDDGGQWQPLQLNLPIVPITDLAVKGDYLIVATQGRGFWAFDHLPLLRQLETASFSAPVELFAPAPTVLGPESRRDSPPAGTGTNPAKGVVVFYELKDPAEDLPVRLELLEEDGTLIRSFERQLPVDDPEESSKQRPSKTDPDDSEKEPEVTAVDGLNRFVWDLRYEPPTEVPGMIFWGPKGRGPRALPGNYLVRLTAGESSKTAQFRILQDPRSTASEEALQAQFDFLLEIRTTLDEAHRSILTIREIRDQLEALQDRLSDEETEVLSAALALGTQLTAIEEALYQTKNQSRQDPLNFPIRLNNKLAAVAGGVDGSLERPTNPAEAVREELTKAIETEITKFDKILEEELVAFNSLVREKGVPAIALPPTDRNETTPDHPKPRNVETEDE